MKEAHIDIEMTFKSEEESGAVYGALKPEEAKSEDRARTNLRKERNKIYLEIMARDTAALRASINSYFRWIRTSFAVLGEM